MADSILKTCAACRVARQVADFSVLRSQPDGRRTICKTCQKAENRASYLRHQEKRQAEGRARQAEWRKAPCNAEKNRSLARDWYRANGDRAKEGARRWSVANPDLKKLYDRGYREENRGRINAQIKTYKMRKVQAVPKWADLDAIAEIYRACDEISRSTGVRHHVDHFYPLQSPLVCGLHHELNLRIIPATDNLKKGNRLPAE